MAASVAMQLLQACPVTTSLTNRHRVVYFSVKYGPRLRRNANVCISCLAEDDEKKHLGSRKFSDVFFSGTIAERINGRLAMIGFVAAMAIEFGRARICLLRYLMAGFHDPIVKRDESRIQLGWVLHLRC